MGVDNKKMADRKRKYTSDNDDENESEESSSSISSASSENTHRKKKKKHSKDTKRKHSSSSTSEKRKRKKKGTSKSSRESISEDDYFVKSAEFRMWLSEERGIFFSDLTSEQSRKLFRKFVRRWNSGELKKKYYAGIESSSLLHSTQTKYKWKLSSADTKNELSTICQQVSTWTGGDFKDDDSKVYSSSKRIIGPQKKAYTHQKRDPFEEEEKHEKEQEHLKRERRAYRKYNEMVIDELLPKATGNTARIEKKKIRAESRREREISPDVISESALMGSETRWGIKDKIKAQQEEREHRAQVASQKVSDYQAKERARAAAILEMAKANKKEGALW